jgi:hypothetical protein
MPAIRVIARYVRLSLPQTICWHCLMPCLDAASISSLYDNNKNVDATYIETVENCSAGGLTMPVSVFHFGNVFKSQISRSIQARI